MASPFFTWRLLKFSVLGFSCMLCACGKVNMHSVAMDKGTLHQLNWKPLESVGITYEHLPKSVRPEKERWGTLRLSLTDDKGEHNTDISVRRIKGGFALELPLMENEDNNLYLAAERGKKFDNMIGIVWRWNF